MTPTLGRITPNATRQTRMDFRHVMALLRSYRPELAPAKKQTLVETVCVALEVQAQLEEEIVYPALRELMPDGAEVGTGAPPLDEMRRLIATLRLLDPADADYDASFEALMHHVIRHAGDAHAAGRANEPAPALPAGLLVLLAAAAGFGAALLWRGRRNGLT